MVALRPIPAAPPTPSRFDLDELADAHRLADWMFDQFRPVLSDAVLEVGPGIGTFTERLLDAGAKRLLLVEPDPAFDVELERRFGHDARVTLASDRVPGSAAIAATAGTWGLVLCQNVLEHVEDDAGAMDELAGALRPGGALALLVPAHPRLYGALDRTFGHHRRYTRDRVASLVAGSGLELADLYSFNLLGVPGWWVKNRAGARSLGPRSLAAYERMVGAWRTVEARRRPPWGLSLDAIARRP